MMTTKLEMLCPMLVVCVFVLMKLCKTLERPVEAAYFSGLGHASWLFFGLYVFFGVRNNESR